MLQLNFIPFPELTTNRLILRRVSNKDLAQLLALRSNEAVMKYIGRKSAETLQDAADFLKQVDDNLDTHNGILWGISFKKNPGLMIGYIGHWRLMKEHFRAEVGYMLLPEFWNKGIMKEALQEAIAYGFDVMKLHSIEARINPENFASASLLTSTGFTKEGYFKEDFFYNGKFDDTAVYSILQP